MSLKAIMLASLVLLTVGLVVAGSVQAKTGAALSSDWLLSQLALNPSLGPEATPVYSCTLNVTTSPDGIGGLSFQTAAPLSSYSYLALAPGSYGTTVPANPEYFFLDAVGGTVYKVDAIPNGTTNYNLGIVVYNSAYTPILSDTNPIDNNSASLSFIPPGAGRYYLKIYQLTPCCTGGTYRLITSAATPTPTASPDLTPSPTATAAGTILTDTLEGPNGNNSFANAVAVSVGGTYRNLTFYWNYPTPDVDYYKVWLKGGRRYSAETQIVAGLDTIIDIYNSAQTLVASDDDKAYNDYGSLVEWTTGSSDDWYYIRVTNKDPTDPRTKTYTLIIAEVAPNTATPTRTPTPTELPGASPTPVTGYDQFEPNHDFDHATIIGIGTADKPMKYTNLNFVPYAPWPNHTEDNDFFKVRVKPGLLLTCETLDLSPGTDTNIIIYNNDRQLITGNDDVNTAAGDFRSRVTYFSTYEGWLYILVGQGHPVPLEEAYKYTYSFQCVAGIQATATPTPSPTSVYLPTPLPTYTPYPTWTPFPSMTPGETPEWTATPTPLPGIAFRPLPTPPPAGLAKQTVTAELRVFYDRNENNQPDVGEGVIGLQAHAYDLTDGALLAQGFTDENGRVTFSVPALGSVKIVVSYLNFEVIVPPNGGMMQVRISPRQLPNAIP